MGIFSIPDTGGIEVGTSGDDPKYPGILSILNHLCRLMCRHHIILTSSIYFYSDGDGVFFPSDFM